MALGESAAGIFLGPSGIDIALALACGAAWLLSGVGAIVCAILTLTCMGKAAVSEASPAYAARQVVLAILLMPFFMFGIYLLPILVKSDLLKWRRIEERKM